MTTLTASDIVTTGGSIGQHRPPRAREIEFFSRPEEPEEWERWAQWLQQMQHHPESVEDDLTSAPSPRAAELGLRLLGALREVQVPPPDIVTLGPNGEIVFERRGENHAEQIVIYDDLRMDLVLFESGRLVKREQVELFS